MSPSRPPVRLGAVEYLNARPLVFELDRDTRFELRFDVPSRCAHLLHQGAIDVGLIPSIEYLRGLHPDRYRIVPDLAIGSKGAVASVMLYVTKPIEDVRSLSLDVSSRASTALVRVLCSRRFGIAPALETRGPDLPSMLSQSDAALMIGDNALFLDRAALEQTAVQVAEQRGVPTGQISIEALDLGEVWTTWTGLPFVYAFWAGVPGILDLDGIEALRSARDAGVTHSGDIARSYFSDAPDKQAKGERYLRDNIRYGLGGEERAGLERFYRYAVETGVVEASGPLIFYDAATVKR